MLLTLYSDASFCPKTLAAGWGAWAKRDDWDRGQLYSGAIPERPPNPGVAELLGLAYAIEAMARGGHLDGITCLVLGLDSHEAMATLARLSHAAPASAESPTVHAAVANGARNPSEAARQAVSRIVSSVGGRMMRLRHVKGHGGGKTARSWVNEQCDRAARLQMVALRAQRNAEAVRATIVPPGSEDQPEIQYFAPWTVDRL